MASKVHASGLKTIKMRKTARAIHRIRFKKPVKALIILPDLNMGSLQSQQGQGSTLPFNASEAPSSLSKHPAPGAFRDS